MSDARVRLDLNNCLDITVGSEKGLSVKDLEAFSGRLESVHKELDEERRLGHHGYRELPSDDNTVEEVKEYAAWARNIFSDVVVIGIGGSSLGPAALVNALAHPYHNLLAPDQRPGLPRVFFLDNPDPTSVRAVLDIVDLPKTLVNVVSKSGGSPETWANLSTVFEPLQSAVAPEDLKDQLVVTTDNDSGDLARLAGEMNFRAFGIPKGVNGRYSVMSPAGLLPLALGGHNVDEFVGGAKDMDRLCATQASPLRNPAYAFALVHYLMDELKDIRQNVFFPYGDRLSALVDWLRQVWGESLGKKQSVSDDTINAGPTPIRARGATDQHSQVQLYVEGPKDKLITFIDVKDYETREPIPKAFPNVDSASYLGGQTLGQLLATERKATEYALTRAGRPNMTLSIPSVDERTLGQLMMMFMVATTAAGKLYEVNPYDQPCVEETKIATFAMMGKKGFADRRHEYVGRYAKNEKFIVG
jgi:glucose-6-phosphate isomerase